MQDKSEMPFINCNIQKIFVKQNNKVEINNCSSSLKFSNHIHTNKGHSNFPPKETTLNKFEINKTNRNYIIPQKVENKEFKYIQSRNPSEIRKNKNDQAKNSDQSSFKYSSTRTSNNVSKHHIAPLESLLFEKEEIVKNEKYPHKNPIESCDLNNTKEEIINKQFVYLNNKNFVQDEEEIRPAFNANSFKDKNKLNIDSINENKPKWLFVKMIYYISSQLKNAIIIINSRHKVQQIIMIIQLINLVFGEIIFLLNWIIEESLTWIKMIGIFVGVFVFTAIIILLILILIKLFTGNKPTFAELFVFIIVDAFSFLICLLTLIYQTCSKITPYYYLIIGYLILFMQPYFSLIILYTILLITSFVLIFFEVLIRILICKMKGCFKQNKVDNDYKINFSKIHIIPSSSITIYNRNSFSNDYCHICQHFFKISNAVCVLKCNKSHIFHKKCMEKWLENYKYCPICKDKIEFHDN